MARLMPRCLCVVTAPTFLWMTLSPLQPRIWLTILGRNQMMMVRLSAQIHAASPPRNQASKHLNRSFKQILSDSSNTLKSSNTVLLVSVQSTSQASFLMRMWHGNASTITLWILPPQALWPKGILQAATQLQISGCEDGMRWLASCLRIWVVRGNFSYTLEGGQMGDNWEFFGEVMGFFLVFCLFYYYIIHIHACRAVLDVHIVGINRWDFCLWEMHSGSDSTPCMAIM